MAILHEEGGGGAVKVTSRGWVDDEMGREPVYITCAVFILTGTGGDKEKRTDFRYD